MIKYLRDVTAISLAAFCLSWLALPSVTIAQQVGECNSCCRGCSNSFAPQDCNCGNCCDVDFGDSLRPLDRHKQGFYQLWEADAGWIGSGDEFEQTELSTFFRVAVPLDGTTDNILAIQPSLKAYFLDGPQVVDTPSKLYDAQLSFLWRKEISDRWQSNVWVQPTIRSDYEETDDSFFLSGGAFARYSWKPGLLDVYLGAFYLDRDDISVLPAVGFIWTPDPSRKYEIVMPRPRLSHRIARGCGRETWLYIGGQLGGGTFAVQRASGVADKLTLRDLRAFFGIEEVRRGGGGLFAEVGYVFDRAIEYRNNDEEYNFDDALMLRAGVRY